MHLPDGHLVRISHGPPHYTFPRNDSKRIKPFLEKLIKGCSHLHIKNHLLPISPYNSCFIILKSLFRQLEEAATTRNIQNERLNDQIAHAESTEHHLRSKKKELKTNLAELNELNAQLKSENSDIKRENTDLTRRAKSVSSYKCAYNTKILF